MPIGPGPAPSNARPEPADPDKKPDAADPEGKTFSFHFTLGRGPNPVEIKGSFTIAPAR